MAEPSSKVTPPLSVKMRRWLRLARTKQGALALVAGALAILLVVDLVVLGGWSGHSNNKVAAGRHESNNGSVAGVGAGGGSTGTTTANGSVPGGGASSDGQGGGSTGQGGGTGGGPPRGSGLGPRGVPPTAPRRPGTPATLQALFP